MWSPVLILIIVWGMFLGEHWGSCTSVFLAGLWQGPLLVLWNRRCSLEYSSGLGQCWFPQLGGFCLFANWIFPCRIWLANSFWSWTNRLLWHPLNLRMEIFLLVDFTGLKLGIVLKQRMLRQKKNNLYLQLYYHFILKIKEWDSKFLEEFLLS